MIMDSLEKSAIANLLSDEKLKLVKLDEQEYMEGQIAFRSQQNEQEMMLEATFQTIKKYKSSQENYSILSIGCGSGLFEKPFLTELLELNKSIHFVGVDSNKLGCIKIKEWCQELSKFKVDKFRYQIHPVEFEKFESSPTFDIILLIHSFYYFSEIESSFQKIYELLGEEGIVIIAIAVKTELKEPSYYVNQRLDQKQTVWSHDLYQFFSEHHISFHKEVINSSVNIAQYFQKDSQLGRHLLDFIVSAKTRYFSPSQLKVLLDYLSSNSKELEDGKIMIPSSVSLYYFQKKKEEEVKEGTREKL